LSLYLLISSTNLQVFFRYVSILYDTAEGRIVQIPRLREWRETRALTQVELAERAGVSSRSVAGYEAGTGARPPTVRKLAKALGVEVTDLMAEASRSKAMFRRWLEDRFGHSYLARSEDEIVALFEGFSGQEDEEERKRRLFDAITAEYLATAKTRNLPKEERMLVRGYHREATEKWDLAGMASGQWERVQEEFEQSIIKGAREAPAESETA
jgi:transcriptional regulator with XRE-family HTH domain